MAQEPLTDYTRFELAVFPEFAAGGEDIRIIAARAAWRNAVTAPTPPTGRALIGLGARLRALREAAGLSGVQLAERLGAGWRQSKVSKLETGRRCRPGQN